MISNSGNSTHYVSCLYSEGKAIKPIYHVKPVAEYTFRSKLPATLKIGWQAPVGILGPGSGDNAMTHSFTFSGFREALFGEVRMFPAAENTRSDLELAADTAKMTLTRFRQNWKLDCSLCASQYESWSIEGITKKLAHSLSIGWLSPCSLKTELLLLRCLFSLASSFSLVYFLIISLTVSFSHLF